MTTAMATDPGGSRFARMWDVLFPEEAYPGDDEADQRIEDYISISVEWQAKIQRAHDLLGQARKNKNAHLLMPALRRGLEDSQDTLCWVLGHQQNKAFETTLDIVETVLRAVGAEVREG